MRNETGFIRNETRSRLSRTGPDRAGEKKPMVCPRSHENVAGASLRQITAMVRHWTRSYKFPSQTQFVRNRASSLVWAKTKRKISTTRWFFLHRSWLAQKWARATETKLAALAFQIETRKAYEVKLFQYRSENIQTKQSEGEWNRRAKFRRTRFPCRNRVNLFGLTPHST